MASDVMSGASDVMSGVTNMFDGLLQIKDVNPPDANVDSQGKIGYRAERHRSVRSAGEASHRSDGAELAAARSEMRDLIRQLSEVAPDMAPPMNQELDDIYKLQGMSEAQGVMQLWPRSSMTQVVIRCCGGAYGPAIININGVCNSVKIEDCTNVEVMCCKVMESVVVSKSQKVMVMVGGRYVDVSLDSCNGIIVRANAETLRHPGVTVRGCSGVVLQRPTVRLSQVRWTLSRLCVDT